MAIPVVTGASICCTMGLSPGTFTATSQTTVMLGGSIAGTIMDSAPMVNVGPCGMCTSMSNPAVASATAAAMGVLTPMPCVPSPAGSWLCSPGPVLGGQPSLTNDGKLMCAYGGTIQFTMPGQTTVSY